MVDPARRELVAASVQQWADQLLDLSANNNLLYFRDLRRGTLALDPAAGALDVLLAGEQVPLAALAADDDADDLRVRAAALVGKAAELAEERGLDALHVTFGLAAWDDVSVRARKPAAPVILIPVAVSPGRGRAEYAIQMIGEPRVNPAMLRKLTIDFAAPVSFAAVDDALQEAADRDALRAAVDEIAAGLTHVPSLNVDNHARLGTFSYTRLPMVQNLEASLELLADHLLIAALCGDQDARNALNAHHAALPIPPGPDEIALADERLVLDADSSQSRVVGLAVAGHNLAVQGPPGTGKSQAIALLIAELAAQGKRVLFVASKRAAIDAVVGRLDDDGLGALVADLHGRNVARGAFAAALAESLAEHGAQPAVDLTDLHQQLRQARQRLVRRADAEYQRRDPSEVTVHETRTVLTTVEQPTPLRISHLRLRNLDRATITRARAAVADWLAAGAGELFGRDAAWLASPVSDLGQTPGILELARRARAGLTDITASAERLRAVGITPASDLRGLRNQLTVGAELAAAIDALGAGVVFSDELDLIAGHLADLDAGASSRLRAAVSRPHRQSFKRACHALADNGRPARIPDAFAAFAAALKARDKWRRGGGADAVPDDLRRLRDALSGVLEQIRDLAEDCPHPSLTQSLAEPTDQLLVVLAELSRDVNALAATVAINQAEQRLASEGLDLLVAPMREDPAGAPALLEQVIHASLLDWISLNDPHLTGDLTPMAAEYARLDLAHRDSASARVLRDCALRSVQARDRHPEQAALVARQAALRPRSRRHLPVRELIAQAPDVILALRPCLAMSPLMVSELLPAVADLFDVVISDEASQMTPAEAIPAIMRARQAVIAGDRHQLPPTRFFTAAQADEDPDDDRDGTAGFQSLLDSVTGVATEVGLTWHYRSHDQRLIAFSNHHVYGGRLETFPGSTTKSPLRLEVVNGAEGAPATAEHEAERVVDLIAAHALCHPQDSLGVIALSLAHANRINDTLTRRRSDMAEGPELDALDALLTAEHEPAFIKNLERVQGDERDRVILAVGFAPDPDTGVLAHNFGPVNQDGGERRLNVAITRARKAMTVVSCIRAEDIDPGRVSRHGGRMLREFLAYAQAGGDRALPPQPDRDQVAIVTAEIRDALTALGLTVVTDAGMDLAVVDPADPDRFVLAVDVDGPDQHAVGSARDRERLREQQLRRLGWRVCRIFPSAWIADPHAQMQRLLPALDGVLAAAPSPTAPAAPARPARPQTTDRYDPAQIAALAAWLITDTLPRTRAQLTEALIGELGFARGGARVDAAVAAALDLLDAGGARTPPPTGDPGDCL